MAVTLLMAILGTSPSTPGGLGTVAAGRLTGGLVLGWNVCDLLWSNEDGRGLSTVFTSGGHGGRQCLDLPQPESH